MRRVALVLALCLTLPVACDPGVPDAPGTDAPPPVTILDGVFAGGGGTESGRVVLEIEASIDPEAPAGSGDARARASFYFAGAVIRVAGSYDLASTELNLEGSGYTVVGQSGGRWLEGSYDGPAGPGVLVFQLRSPALQSYCGTFTGTVTAGGWNTLVSADGIVTGVIGPTNGNPDVTHGVLQGTTFTTAGRISSSEGTIERGRVEGTWIAEGLSGTFEGSTAACPVVP